MIQIIKQYASLNEGKCSILVVSTNQTCHLFGIYDTRTINFLDNYVPETFAQTVEDLEEVLTRTPSEEKIIKESLEKTKKKLEKLDSVEDPVIEAHNRICQTEPKEDWSIVGNQISYINTNVLMPEYMIEHICFADDPTPYIKFWKRLAANPLTRVKERIFHWITSHGIKITPNGLLIGYRGAVSISSPEHKDHVVEVYQRCVNAKKGVKTHGLVRKGDEYSYRKLGSNLSEGWEFVSDLSLEELNQSDVYTHSFARSDGKKILFRLNEVYRDDLTPDTDSSVDCSTGIHVGTINYSISSFGDVFLACLVCPSMITAVPDSDANKLRAKEIYPFMRFGSQEEVEHWHETSGKVVNETGYLDELKVTLSKRAEELEYVNLDFKGESEKINETLKLQLEELERLQEAKQEKTISAIKQLIADRVS